jgi:hypothetical protein
MQTVVLRPHVAVKHFSATCACFCIICYTVHRRHYAHRKIENVMEYKFWGSGRFIWAHSYNLQFVEMYKRQLCYAYCTLMFRNTSQMTFNTITILTVCIINMQ